MRQLTFCGFLARYVRQLSQSNTNSICKLAQEATSNNPRLKAPLLLFALYSGNGDMLLSATKDAALQAHYHNLLRDFTPETMTIALDENNHRLDDQYFKVWHSYQAVKNRSISDADTKELIRNKVRRLQGKSGVTNCRIYKDLGLNTGNLNAWLDHGHTGRVSLSTARRVLRYVEDAASRSPHT